MARVLLTQRSFIVWGAPPLLVSATDGASGGEERADDALLTRLWCRRPGMDPSGKGSGISVGWLSVVRWVEVALRERSGRQAALAWASTGSLFFVI